MWPRGSTRGYQETNSTYGQGMIWTQDLQITSQAPQLLDHTASLNESVWQMRAGYMINTKNLLKVTAPKI